MRNLRLQLSTPSEDVAYQEAEQESFQALFKHVRETIISNPHVVRLTVLTDKLVEIMKTFGCYNVKQHTKNHIRRKLETEFNGALHFISEANGKVLVYPDNISLAQVLRENVKPKDTVHNLQSTNNISHCIV